MQGKANVEKGMDPSEEPQVRVTDRRRIHLAEESGEPSEMRAEPSLKPTYVEELEARTRAAEKLVAEVQSRFDQLRQQLQRETDETRVRLNRAALEKAQHEKADFIAALLPVSDNLERAIQAADNGSPVETVLTGIRGTAASFASALANSGVEPIESVGSQFDPEIHEAVDTVEVGPDQDGIVTKEYARGFKMGDRLLRPARVQVGYALGEFREAHR